MKAEAGLRCTTYGNELYLEERMLKDWEADEELEKDRPEGRTALETTSEKAEETSWAPQAPGTGGAEQLAPALCTVPWRSPSAGSRPSSTPEDPHGSAAWAEERQMKVRRVSILHQELRAPLFWEKV